MPISSKRNTVPEMPHNGQRVRICSRRYMLNRMVYKDDSERYEVCDDMIPKCRLGMDDEIIEYIEGKEFNVWLTDNNDYTVKLDLGVWVPVTFIEKIL